ncbi:hypothetical protein RHO15_10515 [Utexia brackfieldae]|uniref:hypothetical protein n=1 Tax=Utexia brackfieldae TaxID=3074108 RepID=UPI00370D56EB
MIKRFLFTALIFIISGCALKHMDAPQVLSDCQYKKLSGDEFIFMPLSELQQSHSYNLIYSDVSRQSSTLPSYYQGLKGKLTDKLITRDYPHMPVSGQYDRHCSVINDCDAEFNLPRHLSKAQQEKQIRISTFLVRQAILSNCEVVYIRLDPLSDNYLAPSLINAAGLEVISQSHD